jgi:hypothetical protein
VGRGILAQLCHQRIPSFLVVHHHHV